MEKLMTVIGTVAIFFVFFAVIGVWDIHVSVRMIFSAMFAAIFTYIFFRSGKRKTND